MSLKEQLNGKNEILFCNLPSYFKCHNDLIQLSSQEIPMIYGVRSFCLKAANLPIHYVKSHFSSKTKFLTLSLVSNTDDYVEKVRTLFDKAFPLIIINVNKLHTLKKISEVRNQNSSTCVRYSIYYDLFILALSRLGCESIETPKMLYEFVTLISMPLDWVDIYNLISQYKDINFMLLMHDLSYAKCFQNNDSIEDTPIVLMRYTNSKTIDLIKVESKGSVILADFSQSIVSRV
uniref:27b n=1 Tax=Chelonus inanitus TaxID=49201 RepID=D7FBA0_9HYME|nr:27b [Chelonus inanitus]